jgi:hypothetical protein
MTIGRSNNFASETRFSVSWNVDRAPNNGRNCFGRTSLEAGQSRVPAPPHMISGIIRLSIDVPNCSLSTACHLSYPSQARGRNSLFSYCQIGINAIPKRRGQAGGVPLQMVFDICLSYGKRGRDAPDFVLDS